MMIPLAESKLRQGNDATRTRSAVQLRATRTISPHRLIPTGAIGRRRHEPMRWGARKAFATKRSMAA